MIKMYDVYQSPTIEQVGGDNYQPDSPVLFLVFAAVAVALTLAAVVNYALVVEFQEILIVSPP
ncbi:MAG: hypothetical protein ABIL18_05750 [candidate division WOR-3 bacterium]